MMGGRENMMGSYGHRQIEHGMYRHDYDGHDRVYRDPDGMQREWGAHDHDMDQWNREARHGEQSFNDDTRRAAPDRDRTWILRRQWPDLHQRYDDRGSEFESGWDR